MRRVRDPFDCCRLNQWTVAALVCLHALIIGTLAVGLCHVNRYFTMRDRVLISDFAGNLFIGKSTDVLNAKTVFDIVQKACKAFLNVSHGGFDADSCRALFTRNGFQNVSAIWERCREDFEKKSITQTFSMDLPRILESGEGRITLFISGFLQRDGTYGSLPFKRMYKIKMLLLLVRNRDGRGFPFLVARLKYKEKLISDSFGKDEK